MVVVVVKTTGRSRFGWPDLHGGGPFEAGSGWGWLDFVCFSSDLRIVRGAMGGSWVAVLDTVLSLVLTSVFYICGY